ncbi:uncharacterized protein TRAVEDRAFT_22739 [Trametes versicolor FP-101664 SS1]|uniref:uncharacterized protein n=1 Tax=Trametes versicolor (strain FP-101664) TaxID=717944 RepID=UPI000462407C|nr:uncharacterized protein TRAVEDRAFT_22739 [Trametes versicolor FP-101664 SS1]EIW54885.1 hypothetical protein TRAVEDRAFT_22739 [Trametes versicolor FP-101664 SS1]
MPLPSKPHSLDVNPAICTMLNPSVERVYILTESVLRFVIEHDRLPFTVEESHEFSAHLVHDVGSIAEDPLGQGAPVVSATNHVSSTRKTLGGGTRKVACESCYEARKRCEGPWPCSGCKRRQLPCVPRKPRPRKARAIRFAKDFAAHAPHVGNHDEHSSATYLLGEHVNAEPGFLPDYFSAWHRNDDVDVAPMQHPTFVSSSPNIFEYASGSYDRLT